MSTIAVATKEMLREVEPDDPLREDIVLLAAESDRCRTILARLSVDPAGDVSDAYTLVPLPALIEAAAQNYKRDGIAITFDVISAKCEYVGGVIAPGIGIASEALFSRAARLSRVEIKDPGKVIGTNTVTHMQAGN